MRGIKKRNYFTLFLAWPILMAIATGSKPENTIPEHVKFTGIILDSITNEIQIGYENDVPSFYYANIFTPVCNTGECLPIYINIYWDLCGNYLRFDQPTGEILTKLDHVPFTSEDYLLLDKILHEPDPRYGDYSKHSPSNPGDQANIEKNQSLANPAPSMENRKMLSKYEMVDGITGATAIQHKPNFVPGALYTTYTLWGLANDHRIPMLNYTKSHFLVPAYYNHFLSMSGSTIFPVLLEKLYLEKSEPNARANTQMTIIDTSSVEQVQLNILNAVQYTDLRLDTVCHTLERTFFRESGTALRKAILLRWTYFAPDTTLLLLSKSLALYPEVLHEITTVFLYQQNWPEGVLENLIAGLGDLKAEQRDQVFMLFDQRKDYFSREESAQIKTARKNYKN